MLLAGSSYAGRFYISDPDTGALANADSLPTGALIKNGDVDSGVSVTISNVSTGIYKFSCTVPSNYSEGDLVNIQISGTIGGISFAGTLPNQIIALDYTPGASTIWSYDRRTLTMPAQAIADLLSGTILSIHRGDTVTLSISALGDISDRTKLWFTVKKRGGDPSDTASIIQILEYAGTDETSGLLYIEGAAPTSNDNGSITVIDASAGDITIVIEAVEVAKLTPNNRLRYDVQMLNSSGDVTTLTDGTCSINEDVTRSTS
jgi:hypothetical protein